MTCSASASIGPCGIEMRGGRYWGGPVFRLQSDLVELKYLVSDIMNIAEFTLQSDLVELKFALRALDLRWRVCFNRTLWN